MLPQPPQPDLHQAIRALLLAARAQVRQTVNTAMVQTYWHIGRMIVEDEQGGQKRAAYGKQVLSELAKRLSDEFGAGFEVSNLRNMRQFFQYFPIRDALRLELTWTHYRSLIRIENPQSRDWYAKESAEQGWSVRALDRQISTLYYEWLLSSQDQATTQLKDEAAQNIAKNAAPDPRDFIRDPYVLEFLGAPAVPALYEKDLEQGLLEQLQTFLLELGKGFAFVARQKHLRVEDEDCFIDLVFYNYLLKCFVLVDLKVGRLAAEQGNASAQNSLAFMYDTGKGVKKDNVEAVTWYRLAAEQGDASAQSNLGTMYANGHGVVQDYAEAAKWYRSAAQQGHESAQLNLGYFYSKGQGVVQDYVKAYSWYHLSTVNGDTSAVKNRDYVAKRMTAQQIADAQKLARDCQARQFKECD